MQTGDRLVIYETGNVKSAVGTAEVVSVDVSDPKRPLVKIRVGKALGKRVSLEEIKKKRLYKDSPLVKMGRLSVVPLTAAQYEDLVKV
jgi:predicted RNA-binding protein with PUA-like domain